MKMKNLAGVAATATIHGRVSKLRKSILGIIGTRLSLNIGKILVVSEESD